MNNKVVGNFGEDLAKLYLMKNNYLVVECNYRCKFGEIDIIASKDDELVFVEVKTRNSISYGYPSEAVNKRKQRKIINSSKEYMLKNNIKDKYISYSVIEVYLRDFSINHIENAFCGGEYA